ncbi:c-type cytochrome [Paraburkholderia antibiotica]|uniref:C-type cytochrome n=1 Tax=Paraburkholderia antibiotica TaxID=2728839 RepID=A0A7X9X4L9_9BURK|nr:c-type cytochrome [Paraburkholderia antibiotica]NML30972.1 c-type cytochrome [Paraburkholderia antibiotica]
MIRALIVPLVAVLAATSVSAAQAKPAEPVQPAVDAARAQDLAKQHACFGCHAVDKKLVGPAYRDVAARYAGKPGALATLVAHVQNGTSGGWGAVPMPPNQISTADAQTVVQWILAGSRSN